MIIVDIFTRNEAFINLVCFLIMTLFPLTWDHVRKLKEPVELIAAAFFGVNFLVLTISVLINGIVKGF